MQVTRRASVERNRLRFAAAHFATFSGDCESLHGHNYDITVDVEGPLTDDAWVCDFGVLKQMTRELAEQLDHKFLLQLDSKVLKITEHQASWEVSFGERTFVFPRTDVAPLNIDNSTAERLAEWFANSLWGRLEIHSAGAIRRLTVGIEEMPGQTGWYTLER